MGRIYVYGDESGDPGFKFETGSSSRYFIVSLVVISDLERFHSAMNNYRSSLRKSFKEFHFSSLDPDEKMHILEFLKDQGRISFEACVLVVDKTPPPLQREWDTNEVYERSVISAFENHRHAIADAKVRMDKTNHGGKNVLSRIKSAVNVGHVNPIIHDIEFERSHRSEGIQIADVVCGAVWHKYKHNRPEYLEMIRKRVSIVER